MGERREEAHEETWWVVDMITITVQRSVSMGHRLPSYQGLCSSPHGHNLRVEVEVEALSSEFLDFKLVDKRLAEVLEPFDHAMLLHDKDVLCQILLDMKFRVVPFSTEPTTEAIAWRVAARMMTNSDGGSVSWGVRRVTVYETDKYSATVRA